MYICDETKTKPSYRPGLERRSMYKSLWIRHWYGFQKIYSVTFEKTYGALTKEKIDEVVKLLRCGKFKNGFQRYTCPECGTLFIVPFTCKSRLCLSCARKRLFGWSLNLSRIMNTELNHTHITFTIPGTIAKLLFERNYEPVQMMGITASLYKNLLRDSAKVKGKEYLPGIIATLHKCGNSLNYNPHVHMIATRELVDVKNGEIIDVPFLPYKKIRFVWKKAFLAHLRKQNMINDEEYIRFNEIYKNGFHVYFQPIQGDSNEVLFRTAEYIATGYFHNKQIECIDHAKMTLRFKYKCMMERGSRIKHFAYKTMDIYEFMALMLYFLPDKHRKMLRYYGLYARSIKKKLDENERRTWAKAVKHCFERNPEICPECNTLMVLDVVYSFHSEKIFKKLLSTHYVAKGYLIPCKRAGPLEYDDD